MDHYGYVEGDSIRACIRGQHISGHVHQFEYPYVIIDTGNIYWWALWQEVNF